MSKRETKAKKVYVYADGEEGRSAKPDAERLEFRFSDGPTHAVRLTDFPEAVRDAAAWHGISQKLGDAYASSDDVDDAIEKFLAAQERLQDGDWVTEAKAAGPRTSMVLEAVVAAYAKAGQDLPMSEEDLREKLKDNAFRQATVAKPKIQAEYKRLIAEAATKRAAEAAEAAEKAEAVEGESDLLDDLDEE